MSSRNSRRTSVGTLVPDSAQDSAPRLRERSKELVDESARRTSKPRELERDNELKVLELLAVGRPLLEVLTQVVQGYQLQFPGMRGSVLLLDADGQHLRNGVAPQLPASFCAAIDGLTIGPAVGSCGTAAFTGKATIVADIASDPLWRDYKALALAHGLRACWSLPILGTGGRVLGTFAFYFDSTRPASKVELASIERGARLASLAIERRQVELALQQSEARYRTLCESSTAGIWQISIAGETHFINRAMCEMLEVDRAEQMLGRTFHGFFTPASLEIIRREHAKHVAGAGSSYEIELIGERGGRRKALVGSAPLFDAEGALSSLIGTFTDITETRRVQTALENAAESLRCTGEMAKVGGWALDLLSMELSWSPETCRIHELETLVAPALADAINFYAPEARPIIQAAVQSGIDRGTPWDLELPLITAKGRPIWVRSQGLAVIQDGRTVMLRGAFQDISQHHQDVEEIRRLAFYDLLTGLPNRRLLMDRLVHAMQTSARSGQHGALMFLDLDHFKLLNDTLGHALGDVLLQQVAARLQACVREGDSVARLGGDEFVVVLEALSLHAQEAASQAEAAAKKILDAFGSTYDLLGHAHDSTPSIGIVMFRGEHLGIDELLKRADVAMYQAKSAGRNIARFYDPAMQAAVAKREAQEKDLRRGLAMREFVLHYQIQVDAQGSPIGAEALVRWNHPVRGLRSPAEFIALAEETGLLPALGQWVLVTACVELARWSSLPRRAQWTLAVNVSASQVAQSDFVDHVAAALQQSGANPRLLKLELTESTLVHDVEGAIVKMNAIKACGVGFSLDDFGAGYSSLSYLKRLPLDELKIDQSFVRDLLSDADDTEVARAIVALGHGLGLQVIAEGVETAAQFDILASIGCDAFQGYHLGYPVAGKDLREIQ